MERVARWSRKSEENDGQIRLTRRTAEEISPRASNKIEEMVERESTVRNDGVKGEGGGKGERGGEAERSRAGGRGSPVRLN